MTANDFRTRLEREFPDVAWTVTDEEPEYVGYVMQRPAATPTVHVDWALSWNYPKRRA